jgi:hypothetical protein
MNLDEANKLWYELQPIKGVKFKYNNFIRIIDGENAGNCASVISLVSLEPVSYLVELDLLTGGDVIVLETEIESAE